MLFVIQMTSCTMTEQKKITMTLNKSGEVMILIAGSGTMSIDWGDGTKKETYTLVTYKFGFDPIDGDKFDYIHNYSQASLRTITISGENITHFNCHSNQLINLDVSKYTTLIELCCSINQLTNLDVSNNTQLTALNCCFNSLTSLDVSNNSELVLLKCDDNLLTRLDVSKNTALKHLMCSNNQLTSLDVSKNTLLTALFCRRNQLSSDALNTIFDALNDNSLGDRYNTILIDNNPGTDTCNKRIAKDKGWTFYLQF